MVKNKDMFAFGRTVYPAQHLCKPQSQPRHLNIYSFSRQHRQKMYSPVDQPDCNHTIRGVQHQLPFAPLDWHTRRSRVALLIGLIHVGSAMKKRQL